MTALMDVMEIACKISINTLFSMYICTLGVVDFSLSGLHVKLMKIAQLTHGNWIMIGWVNINILIYYGIVVLSPFG